MKRYPCKILESSGNIRSCPVRLSFPHLFEKGVYDGKESWSTMLLFPKGANLSLLKEQQKKCERESFSVKDQNSLYSPFRDQAVKKHLGGFEPGAEFITASSAKRRPVVVGPDLQPVGEDEIYGGVWALVTMNLYSYTHTMKKGVSFGLVNVQKIADDEPFGAAPVPADDEFEPLDASMTGEDAFAGANAGGGAFGFE